MRPTSAEVRFQRSARAAGMVFDTKVAILVLDDLAAWQKLNVTASSPRVLPGPRRRRWSSLTRLLWDRLVGPRAKRDRTFTSMSKPPVPSSPEITYNLLFTAGLLFRFKQGIRLIADGIGWTINGQAYEEWLSDIVAINLMHAGTGRMCDIRFKDGSRLRVLQGGGQAYRDFVSELHAWLGPQGRASVQFSSGFAQWRYRGSLIASIAFGAMFVLASLCGFALVALHRGFDELIVAGAEGRQRFGIDQ
jgi:hypothetical protein